MTKEAVKNGFGRFVDDAITPTRAEFSATRALTGTTGPGSAFVDELVSNSALVDRRVVQPELERYRERIHAQFEVVLEYAEDPDPPADIESYRTAILEHDAYADALRADLPRSRREAIFGRLVEQQFELGDAVRPLVESDTERFWPAVRETFTREQALAFVDEQFRFTSPLRETTDAFSFTTTIEPGAVLDGVPRVVAAGFPPLSLEFTDEVVRALSRAEEEVVHESRETIDERY